MFLDFIIYIFLNISSIMNSKEEFRLIKLRQAVSAVVFKDNQFLMVSGKDWPENAWCFPQGGIQKNEKHIEAVERELKEELGTDKFKILSKSEIDHMYLFPDKIRKKKRCEGQFQTIWFVKFFGNLEEIKPNKQELNKQSWFNKEEIIPNMMYPEQKEVFSRILEELTNLRNENIL